MKLLKEDIQDIEYLIESNDDGKKSTFIKGVFMQSEKPNRNRRTYPKRIMEREVSKFQKLIDENRAMGELGHPACFHDKTEILTVNDGWKLIKDTSVGELIYTFNIEKKQVEIKPIDIVQVHEYDGNLLEFKGRGVNTKVTPNHNFIVSSRYDNNRLLSASEIKIGLENRSLSHDMIPINNISYIDAINTDDIKIEDLCLDRVSFFSFLGIYLSEGCTIHRKGRKESYVIGIYQNEGDNADYIRNVLKGLHKDLNWSESYKTNYYGNKCITFRCHDARLARYLIKFGINKNKYFDRSLLQYMDSKCAEAFIESYVIGDGRGKLKTKYIKCDMFSTSKKMIEDISQIAFIAGYGTRVFSTIPSKDVSIENRIINSENKNELFFCQIKNSKGKYIDNRFLSITEVPYKGNVYCVTVENSTFYARDNGNSFWSGNSPTVNLNQVSHLITNLTFEGNDVMGKARILENTPMGKIAKALIDEKIKLGVSSRGVGSLKSKGGINEVQDDFNLATIDIVSDPSGIDCWVDGIMEGAEWVLDASGNWVMIESIQEEIKNTNSKDLLNKKLELFEKFIKSIR